MHGPRGLAEAAAEWPRREWGPKQTFIKERGLALQDGYVRTHRNAIVKIDDVLIKQANAPA
jgi:hypothetical protein